MPCPRHSDQCRHSEPCASSRGFLHLPGRRPSVDWIPMCKAAVARLTGTAPTSSCRVRLRLRRLLPASSASAGSSLRPGRSAPGPAHPRRTRSSLGRCSCARQSRARSRPWASGRSHPRRARTEPPSRFGLDWRLILAEPPCTSRNGRSCCQRSACSSRLGGSAPAPQYGHVCTYGAHSQPVLSRFGASDRGHQRHGAPSLE